jgi:hypothetical protein
MLLSVSVGTVSAGDPVKHGGSIVSIGRDSAFVLAQLGRWSDNWRQRMDTELAISRLAGVRFVTN